MSKISLKEKWLVDVPKRRKDIKSSIKIDPKSLKIGPWGSLGGVWGSNWDLLGGGGGGPPKKRRKSGPKVCLEMLVKLHKVRYSWAQNTVSAICVFFVSFIG